MKVLEIMGSLHRGGAETMVMNYYRAFNKNMCQMDFVVHAKFDNDYCTEAESMGATIFLLDRPGRVGVINYIKQLYKTIRKYGPYDAIHIHTNYQAFLAIIAAKLAGIKNIIVHSHTTNFRKHEIIINRLCFRVFSTCNIACGIAAGEAFFGKNNFIVLKNAVDISKFNRNNSVEDNIIKKKYADVKLIGHLASFTNTKNQIFLLEVVKILLTIRRDFKLLLYGNGELLESVKNNVYKSGLEDNIIFCGVTDNPAVVYKNIDLFVLPSLYEGFPMTLIEAQAAKVPILVSDRVSRECDLKCSYIEFLPLEEQVWANKINKILTSPDIIICEKSRLDEVDSNIQWKRLYKIYKECKL